MNRYGLFKTLVSFTFVVTLLFSICVINLYDGGTPAKAAIREECLEDGERPATVFVRLRRIATDADASAGGAVGGGFSVGDRIAVISSFRGDFDSFDDARDNAQFTYYHGEDRDRRFDDQFVWRSQTEGSGQILTEDIDSDTGTLQADGEDDLEICIFNSPQADELYGDSATPTDPVDDVDDLTPGTDTDTDTSTSTDDSEPKCEDSFDFPGAWLVCLVLSIVDSSVDSMVNAIADMLQVGRAEINDDGLKEAWSYFRNIASVLLVVIGLVMIIGQAVSKE